VSSELKDIDRLIQSLYAAAVEHEWLNFREDVLARLCEWAGAVSGVWMTRSRGVLQGELTSWPAGAGIGREPLARLAQAQSQRVAVIDPLPSGEGVGFLLHYSHRSSSLLTSLVLLSFPSGSQTAADEQLRRAVGHMIEASSLSLRQVVQRDEWLTAMGRPSRGSAALVDAESTIYAASDQFRALLKTEFGDADPHELPFALSVRMLQGDTFGIGALHLRATRYGHLYLLHARRPLPLDELSPREQEIARALAEGKTFKTVARQLNIAVSTVANHASRIYKKLGIYRREELVGLLQASKVSKAA